MLEAADGDAFETMWLEMMIEHHEGAIEMAEQEVEDGAFPDALRLARRIADGQGAEIETLEQRRSLLPALANRHGLITGATGTGKTVTLQALAEQLSRCGVPVFMADVKGDLSGPPATPTGPLLGRVVLEPAQPPGGHRARRGGCRPSRTDSCPSPRPPPAGHPCRSRTLSELLFRLGIAVDEL